jgi:hypothetical protein
LAPQSLEWLEDGPVRVAQVRLGAQGRRPVAEGGGSVWRTAEGEGLVDLLENARDGFMSVCGCDDVDDDGTVADGLTGVPISLVQHYLERELLGEVLLSAFGVAIHRSGGTVSDSEMEGEGVDRRQEPSSASPTRTTYHPLFHCPHYDYDDSE